MCEDAALTYLAKLRYNVVAFPRVGIQPLDIIGRDRSTERLGPLVDFVEATEALPSIHRGASASIELVQSSEVSVKTGLQVLARFLNLASSGHTGLDAAFSGARSLSFRFDRPVVETVDPSALDRWLRAATPSPGSLLERYATDGSSAAYAITEVLRVRDFAVEAKLKDESKASIDLQGLHEVLEAKAEYSAKMERSNRVRYAGARLLTFGFKAFEVVPSAGRFVLKDVRPGQISLGPLDQAPPARRVTDDAAVLLGDGLVELSPLPT